MDKPVYKTSRELGFDAVNSNNWIAALVYLNTAARQGQLDLAVLDAMGEAAYRSGVPEVLAQFQNYYKYPTVATHMARAFLMLGDVNSTIEFLNFAKDSALKASLQAMLDIGKDIKVTAACVLPVAEKYPDLYYPEYWRALAAVADAVGREDLTRLSERKSKAFAYKDPNIHFNQALRMLGKGEFKAGWRLYEWRLVPNVSQSNRTELGDIPMWEGERLQGKTLLIYLEQGLGDGIFSLRYIKPLIDEGATIEVVARPALVTLVQASYPQIKVHDEDKVVVSDYWDSIKDQPDFWVYGLSIPYRAGLTQPTNTGKFASAPEDLKQTYAEKLRLLNPKLLPVYTINWHGRIDTDSDRTRAFSVAEFIQVAGLGEKSCVIVSLQKDITNEEASQLEIFTSKNGGVFINAGPELNDFGNTAAWVALSERLLTCDTSVSHVGGALGHPTTVLVRNKAIWQWIRKEKVNTDKTGNLTQIEEPVRPAVWYDSVLIQYALTPEISWLFTTMNKQQKTQKEIDDDKSLTHPEETQLSTPEIRPRGFGGKFRFAGRIESSRRDSER